MDSDSDPSSTPAMVPLAVTIVSQDQLKPAVSSQLGYTYCTRPVQPAVSVSSVAISLVPPAMSVVSPAVSITTVVPPAISVMTEDSNTCCAMPEQPRTVSTSESEPVSAAAQTFCLSIPFLHGSIYISLSGIDLHVGQPVVVYNSEAASTPKVPKATRSIGTQTIPSCRNKGNLIYMCSFTSMFCQSQQLIFNIYMRDIV